MLTHWVPWRFFFKRLYTNADGVDQLLLISIFLMVSGCLLRCLLDKDTLLLSFLCPFSLLELSNFQLSKHCYYQLSLCGNLIKPEKLNNFNGSFFYVDITFETDMLCSSHFNLILCSISTDISIASDPVSNKGHVLTLLVLLWVVTGIICRYVVLSICVPMLQLLMVKSPNLSLWWSNVWCLQLQLSPRHLKSDLQSFSWCPLDNQLKQSLLSNAKLFLSAGVFARKSFQFINLWQDSKAMFLYYQFFFPLKFLPPWTLDSYSLRC